MSKELRRSVYFVCTTRPGRARTHVRTPQLVRCNGPHTRTRSCALTRTTRSHTERESRAMDVTFASALSCSAWDFSQCERFRAKSRKRAASLGSFSLSSRRAIRRPREWLRAANFAYFRPAFSGADRRQTETRRLLSALHAPLSFLLLIWDASARME